MTSGSPQSIKSLPEKQPSSGFLLGYRTGGVREGKCSI